MSGPGIAGEPNVEAPLLPGMPGDVAARVQVAQEALAGAGKNARVIAMHSFLATVCEQQGCSFTFHGEPYDPAKVMAPQMFLPVLTWTVQECARDLLGEDFGCALRLDKESLFGVRSVVPYVTAFQGDLWRALFFMHAAEVVFGVRPNASIEVSPMFEMLKEHFAVFVQSRPETEGEIPWPQPLRLN
jgi:hypothetical protein